MSPDISEFSFEEEIERALLQYGPDAYMEDAAVVRKTAPSYGDYQPGGYRKRKPEKYDRALCLLPRDVMDLVLATQAEGVEEARAAPQRGGEATVPPAARCRDRATRAGICIDPKTQIVQGKSRS